MAKDLGCAGDYCDGGVDCLCGVVRHDNGRRNRILDIQRELDETIAAFFIAAGIGAVVGLAVLAGYLLTELK